MTTIIPFVPSNRIAPRFNATFDGNPYTVVMTWNISAQRYYINVYTVDGTWVVTVPLFQTPPARAVNLASWDPLQKLMTIEMLPPSEWPVPLPPGGAVIKPGTIVDYTLQGFQPATYNGIFRSLQLDGITFTFPLATDPGPLVVVGNVNRMLNMVAGVFQNSTMIFRNGSFEIDP